MKMSIKRRWTQINADDFVFYWARKCYILINDIKLKGVMVFMILVFSDFLAGGKNG